jgi:hypothetical protein
MVPAFCIHPALAKRYGVPALCNGCPLLARIKTTEVSPEAGDRSG